MSGPRGDYRSCYCNMADDPEIHAMSGEAFKLMWILKLTLPTAGIGVVYPTTLADQVGVNVDRLEALFLELEAPKPGGELGWILRDRTIVWLIKALECEPGMKPTSPNHRKNVHASVNKLSGRSAVVKAFRSRYAEWFDGPPTQEEGLPLPIEGDSEGLPKGSGRVADSEATQNQKQKLHKGEAVDLEHPTGGGADDGSPVGQSAATDSPAAQGNSNDPGRASTRRAADAGESRGVTPLPEWAVRVLNDCYRIKKGAVLNDRQKQVLHSMRATLGEKGAPFERGVFIRAYDASHLNDACRTVLTTGVKKPDAAIRLVLLELRKTFQERKAVAEKLALGETPATGSGKPESIGSLLIFPPKPIELAEATTWLATQPPEVRASIDRVVDGMCPPGRAPSYRAQLTSDKIVEAWRNRSTSGAA